MYASSLESVADPVSPPAVMDTSPPELVVEPPAWTEISPASPVEVPVLRVMSPESPAAEFPNEMRVSRLHRERICFRETTRLNRTPKAKISPRNSQDETRD